MPCLEQNYLVLQQSVTVDSAGPAGPSRTQGGPGTRGGPGGPPGTSSMKQDYLVLQQSVTVDVDSLVAQIGEALQLHGGGGAPGGPQCQGGPQHQGPPRRGPGAAGAGPGPGGAPAALCGLRTRSGGCCVRLRGPRGGPYHVPDRDQGRDQVQVRPCWARKRLQDQDRDQDQDPQRLLQELLLSGNLIKEAVRRMQVPDLGEENRS
ncbi:glycogen synthase kinase binding protein [Cololabis saira]|uniref:glycogen synthase kinase binding protein n=1 Tax=Cololabis saira TaxID=129043 RepID=UPI002AD3B1A3|nr:glycogen synthase kinase binding protein [Cololabis saira]